jgi:hypothetical protein
VQVVQRAVELEDGADRTRSSRPRQLIPRFGPALHEVLGDGKKSVQRWSGEEMFSLPA